MSIYIDIFKLKRNIFLDFKTPEGRGDISKIKINKKINLIDESYNSNPLSLESAILNFDKIANKKYKKIPFAWRYVGTWYSFKKTS